MSLRLRSFGSIQNTSKGVFFIRIKTTFDEKFLLDHPKYVLTMKRIKNTSEITLRLNEKIKPVQMNPIKKVDVLSSPISARSNESLINIPMVKSEERANAIFSLLVLLEHRDHWNWNDGSIVDWANSRTKKWCITVVDDQLDIIITFTNKKLLSFGNKESSVEFLETFCKLIEKAKDLL